MSFKVKSKVDFKSGLKELEKFKKNFDSLSKEYTQVGYSSRQPHVNMDTGEVVSMAWLAGVLHEGSHNGNIPSRPFLRNALTDFSKAINNRKLGKALDKFFSNLPEKGEFKVDDLLITIGELVREHSKDYFGASARVPLVPNAASTQRIKGRNDPVVDSGKLKESMLVKTSRGGSN